MTPYGELTVDAAGDESVLMSVALERRGALGCDGSSCGEDEVV